MVDFNEKSCYNNIRVNKKARIYINKGCLRISITTFL